MITGHYFRCLPQEQPDVSGFGQLGDRALLALLSKRVCDPFLRASGVHVLPVAVRTSRTTKTEESPPPVLHPACDGIARTAYSQESRQVHLAALARRPQTHWHKCDYGMLCAIVPCVCRGRCVAALNAVSPPSKTEQDFESCIQVLDAVVRDFMTRHLDFLSEALPCSPGPDDEGDPGADVPEKREHHPKVGQAIEYIEAHLADPGLSVRRVARHLELHADYLSNLFTRQTGQRMAYYIATRRTERAKNLLETTPWRVKRIASECGFANPNWFCRVFGAQTGTTPTEYRSGRNNSEQISTTEILDSLSDS